MKYNRISIYCFLIVTFLISSCTQTRKWHKLNKSIWSTSCHITYESKMDLNDSINSIFDAIGKSISTFDTNSQLSRFNSGESDEVDSIISRAYIISQIIAEQTYHYYDPTVCTAVQIWGFGKDSVKQKPSVEQLDSIRLKIGLSKCNLIGNRLHRKNPDIKLDFNAIAKGLACDMIGEMLERNGCENYLIEIGGEILCRGKNKEAQDWNIMVESPYPAKSDTDKIKRILHIKDFGVATSGNYRRNRIIDKELKCHIINPKTCNPVANAALSATVIAPTAALADGYATAFMIMDIDSIRRVINKSDSKPLGAMIIYEDSTVFIGEFQNYLK